MLARGPHLVIVLFPFQMHEVEFIHQPESLQKVDRAINSCTIDFGVSFTSEFK